MSSEKCFAKGSPAPGPVPQDRLRLYSMRFCPFAQRTRLVLHAKGIKFDTININLKDKPDWFLEKNPYGLVPVIETPAGEVVFESMITSEYLDEVYPEKKLLPATPFGKAKQRMMLEHFSKIIPHFFKITSARRKGDDVSGLEAELKEKFTDLNNRLVKEKTRFFGGDTITLIDYMMWPFFERLEMFEVQHCLNHTHELKKWTEYMLEDQAVKATMHSTDNHRVFFKSFQDGEPDYDYGL
ncbi:glutathione S-transferase omega-1-like [Cyprinodon tularosa]|uniref:glutathione S-transferase omega-1-like n=1 Tax=Cyprinodon tularosa TaxID=77115 RepID=UPI0018E1E430|nr:glutathione S-transferase omega-1-like [Cyprinodon tularosa]